MAGSTDSYTSWAFWRVRLFGPGRTPFTIVEFVAFVGVFPTTCGVFAYIFEKTQTPAASAFRFYLYLSFTLMTLLVAVYLMLYKKVHVDLKARDGQIERLHEEKTAASKRASEARDLALQETHDEVQSLEAAIKIQHAMAEEVRKCAALGVKYDCEKYLQKVFADLRQYLRKRLGHDIEFAVTIKRLQGAKLVALFRDSSQDREARRSGDVITLADSHVYTSFTAPTQNPRRWVVVRDTRELHGSEHVFKARAERSGFRSIVAFPLRNPVLPGQSSDPQAVKYANLFGFLSVDAPVPYAFDELFVRKAKSGNPRNDGENFEACADLELFYGLADSIAAILVLHHTVR